MIFIILKISVYNCVMIMVILDQLTAFSVSCKCVSLYIGLGLSSGHSIPFRSKLDSGIMGGHSSGHSIACRSKVNYGSRGQFRSSSFQGVISYRERGEKIL